MPTIKQQRAVKNIIENRGSMKDAMIEAGYDETTAINPKRNLTNTKGGKELLDPIINKWIRQREKLTNALDKKDLDKETMRDTLSAIDTLTKNIQLLSGKATESVNLGLTDDLKTKANQIIDEYLGSIKK